MKTKNVTVNDPDFGRIQVPVPQLTTSQRRALLVQVVEANRRHSAWPKGRLSTCPRCSERRLRGRDDLQVEIPRGDKILVFLRLRGARCEACDAQFLDGAGQMDLEDALDASFHPDFEAKVTRIGRGTVGTYWPKDLERVLGLRPHRRLFVEVIGRDAALLRVRDARPEGKTPRRRR